MLPPTPAEEAHAASLADDAMAGYDATLPPDVLEDVREQLMVELLFTNEGREKLRRLLPSPMVHQSEEVLREGATEPTKKGSASG
jgi:hypothetical protein